MAQTTINQEQMIADFYRAYQAELVNFVVSRLGNKQESEDLVQDVFIKLMSFEGMINQATIKSFAYTIAANKIKDLLRRRIFRHKMEENTKYEMELQTSHAEYAAEYHETLRIVNDCMDKLTPACAKVYRMSLFEDKSTMEIAQELNLSKRTIESQLFTSRRQMRGMMIKEAM